MSRRVTQGKKLADDVCDHEVDGGEDLRDSAKSETSSRASMITISCL